MSQMSQTLTKTTEYNPKLSDSFGGTVEKNIPEDVVWIDDAFYVEQTRFMWKSVRKDTGKDFLFGMTKEIVIDMSRWHLKCEQEGTLEQYSRVVGDAFVGGKL